MRDERGARAFTSSRHDVDDARRQPGVGEAPGELEDRDGRLFRRLEDDRAARAERRRDLPGRHQQRVVPRNDLRDDADRLAQREDHRVVGHGHDIAVNLGRHARVVLEARRGIRDVALRFDDGLAARERFERRELVGAIAQRPGDAQQDAAALVRRRVPPRAVERLARRGDRRVDIFSAGVGRRRDNLARGGIDHVDRVRAACADELPVDKQLICGHKDVAAYSTGSAGFKRVQVYCSRDMRLRAGFAKMLTWAVVSAALFLQPAAALADAGLRRLRPRRPPRRRQRRPRVEIHASGLVVGHANAAASAAVPSDSAQSPSSTWMATGVQKSSRRTPMPDCTSGAGPRTGTCAESGRVPWCRSRFPSAVRVSASPTPKRPTIRRPVRSGRRPPTPRKSPVLNFLIRSAGTAIGAPSRCSTAGSSPPARAVLPSVPDPISQVLRRASRADRPAYARRGCSSANQDTEGTSCVSFWLI